MINVKGRLIKGPYIVRDGLVLYLDAGNTKSYPGSGTTWTDLSGNGRNGNLRNGPTYGTDGGGSISFDGINEDVSVPFTTDLQDSTVSLWLRADTMEDYVFRAAGASPGYFQLYLWGDGKLQLEFSRTTPSLASSALVGSAGDIATGVWYNVCVTLSPTLGAVIYRNGKLLKSGTWGSTGPITPTNLDIANPSFDGTIAAAYAYSRSLTATEVLQNYNALRSRFGI